jgi:hypothetical protein
MQGKDKNNSHATIKLSCCHAQDATTTILCHTTTSGASIPQSSTASTPKTVCKYTNDGIYNAKGEYSKNTKEAASIKKGHNEPLTKEGDDEPLAKDGDWAGCNNEPLATRAIGRIHRARQQQAPHHNR